MEESKLDLEQKLCEESEDSRLSLIGVNSDCQNSPRLSRIRRYSAFKRVFRPMEPGSMRRVIIMWLRMSMGFCMLTLPFYSTQFGVVFVCLLIVLASIINFTAFKFIFDASYHLEEFNYPDLIDKLWGKKLLNVFRITYLIDILSGITITSIICWNLFEYMIYFFNIGEEHWKEWILDINKITFDETNPTIFKIRQYFFYGTLIIISPLILKKTIGGLQKVTVSYLIALIMLVIIVLIEVPFFKVAYKDQDIGFYNFKSPKYNWFECFLGICGSFYVQPFLFSFRKELFIANRRRMKKISLIGVSIAAFIFLIFAYCGYYALGDQYTPAIFILRKPYPNKNYVSEMLFRCTICLFFVFSTLGLAIFSSVLRDYVYQAFNLKEGKIKYVLISLIPYFIVFTSGFLYPHVINLTNLFGLTIYSFNGYIVPTLLKIKLNQIKNASYITRVFTWAFLGFFVVVGTIGLVFRALGLSQL